jgi:hypothetical protein
MFEGTIQSLSQFAETVLTNSSKLRIYSCKIPTEGPVTLLRMRETYEKRMKINAIIFIRTKIL